MPTFASRAPRCAPPSSPPSSPSLGALPPHPLSLLDLYSIPHISSILARQIDGEHGWVVAQYTTWHDDKQNKCMQILGVAPPWSSKNESTCMRAPALIISHCMLIAVDCFPHQE